MLVHLPVTFFCLKVLALIESFYICFRKMPNCYQRKPYRAGLSEETLKEAVSRMKAGGIGIPARAISQRIERNDCTKRVLGPEGMLCTENEKRLVHQIRNLANIGFLLTDKQFVC
ncbi:hypothetical protein PR048_013035 [Dryococelus australis]|uniref:Uncharacterized protein n=1 Tax=Dryococelus australis TaxID=614101 RepID=A0ABQ9HSJ0_9NEOP|nr:hypothetical protein PR048_013035 [Dryococelus australis]